MTTSLRRSLDSLGRFVIPIDARKALNLSSGEEILISWKEDEIVIRKAHHSCPICGSETELNRNGICESCLKNLKTK